MRLAAIWDQWRRVIAAQIAEKPEPKMGQIGKTENRIEYQIRKSANRSDRQTEKPKFFWHKNRKTDQKNCQNRKTENPDAPLH